jgi:hypothetical protein
VALRGIGGAQGLDDRTGTGSSSTSSVGQRRDSTLWMSRITAPLGDVRMPSRRTKRGSGRLRPAANSPSTSSFAFRASNARRNAPSPASSICSSTSW